jgi:hypothetical protein
MIQPHLLICSTYQSNINLKQMNVLDNTTLNVTVGSFSSTDLLEIKKKTIDKINNNKITKIPIKIFFLRPIL